MYLLVANGFSDLITMLANIFKSFFQAIDQFYLVGQFSLLDFIVCCLAIDIVITALFVTFNVGLGTDTTSVTYDKTDRRTGEVTRVTKNRRRITRSGSAHVGH